MVSDPATAPPASALVQRLFRLSVPSHVRVSAQPRANLVRSYTVDDDGVLRSGCGRRSILANGMGELCHSRACLGEDTR